MFLSGISNAMTPAKSGSDGATLNANFDTFLKLLTTQLRNQNPMEPLDANEFTKQLVQYSGVEQQIKSNANLEALIQMQSVNAATAATSFIGKTITVQSASTSLANGQAKWQVSAGAAAETATFTVRDDTGAVVYEEVREVKRGANAFTWDGTTSNGGTAGDGYYTLTVDARTDSNTVIPVSVAVQALIDGVDFSGSEPVLLSGDRGVPLSNVQSVSQS
ncbi:flagellar hook assembly protein FlgD [Lutibaculum baratangense]|uniref:Basal-body rod modification protein FlgD n=1 Tax=Lutibaculum baratangense AMV1 TaxID=631454 RepID=V4RBB3_9HYPH|nr:flagellar hook assembly protein FlgD [Lutibaculum baratangense]ESR22694.1 Flagellar basal-body rod modification protein FlgD [Lutibaculum baratangense AMV1]